MRRFLRILLNSLTALSLLLFAATVTLWVRSYHLSDQVSWWNERGWRTVRSARGHVEVSVLLADHSGHSEVFHGPRYGRVDPDFPHNWLMELGGSVGDTLADWERAGFAWHERRNTGRGTLHGIAVAPMWSLAAATAAMPLARMILHVRSRLRRRRRKGSGLCPACGYDLRATPDRCPECGTILAR